MFFPNCVVSFVTYDIAYFVDIVKISCILTMQDVCAKMRLINKYYIRINA